MESRQIKLCVSCCSPRSALEARMDLEGHAAPRFSKLKSVGEGSYGYVFKATERETGERVALKVISGASRTTYSIKRTLRELTILRMCRHNSVVNVMEVLAPAELPQLHVEDGDLIYSMELLEIDLASLLLQPELRQGWSPHHVRFLLYQLVAGVAFLHSRGVLHRDLKPSNLLVNAHCDVKICDFGLALVRPQQQSGQSGNRKKSPFMAMRRLGTAAEGDSGGGDGSGGGGGDAGGGGGGSGNGGGGDGGGDDPAGSKESDGDGDGERDPPRVSKPRRRMTMHVVTRWYRAPEVILEWPDYDAAVDMWSVGCIVGEMLESLQTGVAHCTPLFMGGKSAMSDGEGPYASDDSDGDESRITAELLDRESQLWAILQIIGLPGEEDIDACPAGLKVQCRSIRHLAQQRQRRGQRLWTRIDLSARFPTCAPAYVELLERLLIFNPASRISAAEALRLDIFGPARASFEKSRHFSLEAYAPPAEDLAPFVDGFENATERALLDSFLRQEIEAWGEMRRGAAARAESKEECSTPSPSAQQRTLESVEEAKDEAASPTRPKATPEPQHNSGSPGAKEGGGGGGGGGGEGDDDPWVKGWI